MPGPREEPCSVKWFQEVFGFAEGSFEHTRRQFETDGLQEGTFSVGDRRFHAGPFEVLSYEELTSRLSGPDSGTASTGSAPMFVYSPGKGVRHGLSFENIVDSFGDLMLDEVNAGAVFQVASLFNCTQASEPSKRPEDGVTKYALEPVQGSICAIGCPAATVYRNYLVNGTGQIGRNQIDCLSEVAAFVKGRHPNCWSMKNGFCMPRPQGEAMVELSKEIRRTVQFAEDIEAKTKVGIHWDTEVHGVEHRVCQVLCGAAPVGLTKMVKAEDWEPFACCLLGCAYKSTLAAAALLAGQRRKRVRVFLTLVGGGCLNNRQKWTLSAIRHALDAFSEAPLDVTLVHHCPTNVGKWEVLEVGRAPAQQPRIRPENRTISEQVRAIRTDFQEIERAVEQEYFIGHGFTQAEIISKAFSYFDADGNGVLDRREFENALRSIDGELFTPARVDRLLKAADADGDGEIYYGEFCLWLCNEETLVVSRVMATGHLAVIDSMEDGEARKAEDAPRVQSKEVIHRTHCADDGKEQFNVSQFM